MNNKSSIFTSGEATLLMFMSEIKNNLSLKKSNFLFLFLLKNCNNLVYSNRQPSGPRHNFFPGRFASNLMLSAYLLGMFLVATEI